MALALLADLKADLGVSDDTQDVRLESLLLDASDQVLTFIRRPILRAEWRDTLTLGPDEQRTGLLVCCRPLQAITAFSVNGSPWSVDAVAALNLAPDSGVIYPPDGWGTLWRCGRYVVTYQAGWTAPTIGDDGKPVLGDLPRAIQQATRLAAAALYHSGGRDPLLRSESEQGVGSSSWASPAAGSGGLPQAAADALRSFGGIGVR